MEKLTLKTLDAYREKQAKNLLNRTHPDAKNDNGKKYDIIVCGGTGCKSSKANQVYDALAAELKAKGLSESINILKTGCFGFCAEGPIVKIMPGRVFYVQVTPGDAKEIVESHIMGDALVERLLIKEQQEKKDFSKEISFYDKQKLNALRNCGVINMEDINDYIGRDGYKGLQKALSSMTPDDVIETLKASGLRGRGGAGFPTWMKWKFTKDAKGEKKYVVCNGDEGDPGAYMDRSLLEGDPHSIIEAMTIAAYTVGAQQGYFYIRAEYNIAVEPVKLALKEAYAMGFLGKTILGSDFSFDLDIRLGAGAFVCGEETALLASIEGKRGTPRPRPPFPAVKGLFNCPTVINNVETYANVAPIIANGPEWFSSIGTDKSKGTKVFALTGKVNVSSLVEVPMGTTIREIVYDIGGGVPNGKKPKAVQSGGPSGGLIPVDKFDLKISYENLTEIGSMMGSGGLIVIDEDDSIVDLAKFYLGFCVDESCGKCAPCRIGGYQMLTILDRLSKKRGRVDDIKKLEDIALAMKKGSLCGLGQTAANPVLSSIRYFREEFEASIKQ